MINTSNHLVVGINGTIGSALFHRLKSFETVALRPPQEHSISTWGTTKRKEDVVPQQIVYLNLNDASSLSQLPAISFDVVYLCAGICRMALCEDDPIGTSKINVDGMSKLAALMAKRGAFVIYLSTNQVFSGEFPHIAEDAPYQPLNEYGRQKAIVERFIKENCERHAIVRLSKVIEPRMSLIQDWIDRLKQNESISAFHNMMLAPISLRQVIDFLIVLGAKQQAGCYALSGDQDVSYLEVANDVAKFLHAPPGLITPKCALAHGIKKNFLPRFTSMRSSSTIALCGLRPPTIVDVLEECFNF